MTWIISLACPGQYKENVLKIISKLNLIIHSTLFINFNKKNNSLYFAIVIGEVGRGSRRLRENLLLKPYSPFLALSEISCWVTKKMQINLSLPVETKLTSFRVHSRSSKKISFLLNQKLFVDFRPPYIQVLQIDPLIKVNYISTAPGGLVHTSNTCMNSSAVYVTCPDLLCGTRVLTASQLLKEV